jgi:hypothetical protein
MFDRVGRLAERAAVGLSRRTFLARIGLGAVAFATFVGQAAAGNDRWILNGGCCGGRFPYLLQRKIRGNWLNIGCTRQGEGIAIGCADSPNCCGGTGYCTLGAGGAMVCFSDLNCNTLC